MIDPRHRKNRRRAVRRDILATLALSAAIFVSILALPFGRMHAQACAGVSRFVGHDVPCGLSSLSISLDTDRRPFIFVSWKPVSLAKML
jgi:hypothetical protein